MIREQFEPLDRLYGIDFQTLDATLVDVLLEQAQIELPATLALPVIRDEAPESPQLHASPTDGQWHLLSDTGYDINVLTAWQDYTGNGVTVGVVDTGVQYTHHELSANYDASIDYDFLQGNADGANKVSTDKHGTAVAGTIAAANNGTGSTGVAYDATITSFRLISEGQGVSSTQVANALTQDVDVSNNSWGWVKPFQLGDSFNAAVDAALQDAVSSNRGGLGTVMVFSAGNNGAYGDNANYSEMLNSRFSIAVGAANEDGTLASFSNPGTPVLISAPGTQILTSDITGSGGYVSGDYVIIQGTSFSAPIVSGVVALMLEANPGLGYRDVQEILAYSAIQTDASNPLWEYNGAKNWNGGGLHVNEEFGFGFVDATAAVRLAESWFRVDNTAQVFSNESSLSFSSGALNHTFDASSYATSINVGSGLLIEHVEVQLDLSHNRLQDLTITLTSPDGTESILFDRPPSSIPDYGSVTTIFNSNWSFSSTHHWGETGVGQWTLEITDHVSGYSGTLNSWSLRLYGNTLTNNDTYIYTNEYANFTGAGYASNRTLSDGGGNDTINAAAVSSAIVLDLTPGASGTVAGNSLQITSGTVIENAIGGDGDDSITGNHADNQLFGGRGNDTLDGGLGDDTLVGGAGDDIYYVDSLGDEVVENPNEGYDIIYSLLSEYTLSANVELLELIGGDSSITGSDFDDTINGSSGNNTIDGGAGSDLISGRDGHDSLIGGTGNDTLDGGNGNDTLQGGDGNDTYRFSNSFGVDTLTDNSGTDTVDCSQITGIGININLVSGSGAELGYGTNRVDWDNNAIEHAVGGQGNDTISGNSAANSLDGQGGNDTIYGLDGNDTLTGGEGYDTLYGGTGADSLDAGSWSDTLYGDAGDDTLVGGQGWDNLSGGDDNDLLDGGDGNDTLNGGAGNDTYRFSAGWGQDSLSDSSGNDTLDFSALSTWVRVDLASDGTGYASDGVNKTTIASGTVEQAVTGSGNDILIGNSANNMLNGGAGNDTYQFRNVFGQDSIGDASGTDTVDFSLVRNVQLTINLTSSADGEASYGANRIDWDNNIIEHVLGANFGDTISGSTADNSLDGGAGSDSLVGLAGNDTLIGGLDHDTLDGGTGNDVLNGGSGSDTYRFADGWGADTLSDSSGGGDVFDFSAVTSDLTVNIHFNSAGDGTNSVTFTGQIEHVYTGSGNDIITGNMANNTLNGATGDDTYRFRNAFGQDVIEDSGGSDTLDLSQIANVPLTVNLSSGAGAEAGYGYNRVDWDNDAVENVIGSQGHDTITGNNIANNLDGYSGNDTVNGMGGNDTLSGGAGYDTLYGGAGNDSIDGGTWSDTLYGEAGNDTLLGGQGWDMLYGGDDDDVLNGGGGKDTLDGGDGDDTYAFDNSWGADVINDTAGFDSIDLSAVTVSLNINLAGGIIGGGGSNTITWTGDIEAVVGGSGNDRLVADATVQELSGGSGSDAYTGYQSGYGADTIDDLAGDADLLDLSAGFALGDVFQWSALDTDSNNRYDGLRIDFGNGDVIDILAYFDNLSNDIATSQAGTGLIETIAFSDATLNFADVQGVLA